MIWQTPSTAALTFLDPIAGIVAGSIAVPLLVVLYFLKLRRRPARISSTLLWEQAVKDLQANVPFRLVRPNWLLIIQMLVLAALVMALARPAVDLPGVAAERVIVLIDASASMGARDGAAEDAARGVTRLDEAKRRAGRLLAGLSRGRSQAMVVAFAGSAEARTAWTNDRAQLRRAVDAVEQTDQPADFDAVLSVVDAFMRSASAEEADQVGSTRIVLFSDGALRQTGRSTAAIGDASIDFVRVGPAPAAARDNLGVVAFNARRDVDDPGLVRVFVRVANAGPRPEPAGLLLTVDGASVDAASFEVPARRDEGDPGAKGHTFELRLPEGLVVAKIAVNDDLPADNAAAAVVEPLRRARIGLVAPGPLGSFPELALYDAIDAADPASIEVLSADAYAALGVAGAAGRFDVLVFDRVRPDAVPPIPTLSFGAGLPIPGLDVTPDTGGPRETFAFWPRTHPVMRGVSLNTVLLASSPAMTPPGETPAESAAATRFTPLATGLGGPLIALIERAGVRHVIAAPTISATNWPTDQSFPVFVGNAIAHLDGVRAGGAGAAFTTAEAAAVRPPQGVDAITLMSPDGARRRIDVAPGTWTSLGVLPRAGVYEVAAPNGWGVPVAVNLASPEETSLRTSDTVDVAGRALTAGPASGSGEREVWHWFVIAAAILQAIEWLLFGLRSRV